MTKWVRQDHVFSKTRGNLVEGDTTKGINTIIPIEYTFTSYRFAIVNVHISTLTSKMPVHCT